MTAIFDSISQPPAERVTMGLAKVCRALRSRAWREGERHGLTPTQAQFLALLGEAADPAAARPSALAAQLQVSRATVSEALAALTRKGLVAREKAIEDRRAAQLELTDAGREVAAGVAGWPAFLVRTIADLPEAEQTALLRGLMGIIRGLQRRSEIPAARLCVTCRFFRPHVHVDPAAPHHCAFVDAPFGDRHLRLECTEQEPAAEVEQQANWARFIGPNHLGVKPS